MKKPFIMAAMSGGVDSSVAALLLQQQGRMVQGLFMKNWEEDDSDDYCAASKDLEDAHLVCEKQGIPLHTVNFSAEYWQQVFQEFLAEYNAGRTPNPDILCNKEIKFKAFLTHAQTLGASHIATGHYARIRKGPDGLQLWQALDKNKDQSYFLYTLGQAALQKVLFPLGELAKPEVRQIAKTHGLATHAKKDSTGICFIGERRFNDFIDQFLQATPGNIETPQGEYLGQHTGLIHYTLGQRQGLGIGGLKNGSGAPWYVAGKDLARNVLIAVPGHHHPLLYHSQLHASQLHWVSGKPPTLPCHCQAKTRYRQQQQKCTVTQQAADRYQVCFEQPQRAMTPGQSVVFYKDEICLGGGIIETVA